MKWLIGFKTRRRKLPEPRVPKERTSLPVSLKRIWTDFSFAGMRPENGRELFKGNFNNWKFYELASPPLKAENLRKPA